MWQHCRLIYSVTPSWTLWTPRWLLDWKRDIKRSLKWWITGCYGDYHRFEGLGWFYSTSSSLKRFLKAFCETLRHLKMSHLGAYATKASHQCKTESNEGLVFACLSCLHELCFWLFLVIKLIIYYSLSFQKVTLNLNNTLFWGEFQDRGRIWTVHTNISYQHCTVSSRLCVLRGKKSYSCFAKDINSHIK